ncbi:UDP-3-O-(3-hydroxymyristoyl)glucosamine N-acyltransferase [Pelagicoccus sp. SDUM812003]|uniref:UDP-3-O-(3-hydroxymyristoyl)glucosamine N-acyltransferase n=1 Tax=Pelagicoccus sp. SDUM812003 TaxID=3041267 RepID=UPI00280CA757|nr:UDP-3-O-(3-hydroxymyristoyl)glucosamine N-acyltransferase [Pelagicoccus sp. SDUM812003]MDQ8203660.1 UDP-3-O-(3-hydroxymyristoyl)glucosamine N-acyltransferase [Pelagicoccus sp. SDUM812003]
MDVSLSLNTILDRVTYSSYEGELGVRAITGVSSLTEAQTGEACFVSSNKYARELEASKASLVILGEDVEASPKEGQLFLRVEHPSIEIAKLCELIERAMWVKPAPGIHRMAEIADSAEIDPSASIAAFVTIGEGAVVGPRCVIGSGSRIGENCRLGEDCWLGANVSIERDSVLGKRVRIHASTVIGADGFGYEFEAGRHRKVPQIGSVLIGDDVEIGANTTIDRGRFGPTRIGEGTKIDNLVQVGHNCDIGKHCILCAQVGLAGSTTLGNYVVMGARSGAAGHLTIGDGAQLSGECVAYADVQGGGKYGGSPAVSLIAHQRITVLRRRLPDLFRRLKRVEAQLLQD